MDTFATKTIASFMEKSPLLILEPDEQVVVFSDLHMGGGGRADDLLHNGPLLIEVLRSYYLKKGHSLVLNGDVEELQRFSFMRIREQWRTLFEVFNRFNSKSRLIKILGNHDAILRFVPSYPYALYEGIRVRAGELFFHIFHGHQSQKRYERVATLIAFLLRYIATPLGIRNIANRRRLRKRFAVEQAAYTYSLKKRVISLIGHSHRSLFESLSRYDHIKYQIERLCSAYPHVGEEERTAIAHEVRTLRRELEKFTRKERKTSTYKSLYGEILPVPCLFNSGNCIGKKGLTCIELDTERISLVYWYSEGRGKKFVSRGGYTIEAIEGSDIRRVVLNTDTLANIAARIELLS